MRRIGSLVINGGTFNFWAIKEHFGFVSRHVLFKVGKATAEHLYYDEVKLLLRSHQTINDVGFSKTGKVLVSFSLAKNDSVVVRSFPMNVYRAKGERGPRSMKRTAGKKIFRSFESKFDVTYWAKEALEDVINDEELQEQPSMNKLYKSWNNLTRLKKTKGGLKEGGLR
jgi:hypothetical protein